MLKKNKSFPKRNDIFFLFFLSYIVTDEYNFQKTRKMYNNIQ